MSELPEIQRRIVLTVSPERVWQGLVDGELCHQWFGGEIEPRLGGQVTLDETEIIGTVEEIIPGESITWSWRTPDGEPSQVTIRIDGQSPDVSDHGTRNDDTRIRATEVTITERLLKYQIVSHRPLVSESGSNPVFVSAA